MSQNGGTPAQIGMLPKLDIQDFTDVLPGGQFALANSRSTGISADYANVLLVDLHSRTATVLVPSGFGARYVAPGYLLYAHGSSLSAIRFDASSGKLNGEAVVVATDAGTESLFGCGRAGRTGRSSRPPSGTRGRCLRAARTASGSSCLDTPTVQPILAP